jgi:TonB family protein
MMEQEAVMDDEPPPEEAPPEAPPSEDLSTGITGNGPDMGLSASGGGSGRGIGTTNNRRGGSRFGWYAAKVQSTISDALRRNSFTRNAILSIQVRVWADASGRITRAQLVGSSGNAAVDTALKDQILTGLQLPQAPPVGMPMPINLRITARKSSL